MRLPAGEPDLGPWRPIPTAELAATLVPTTRADGRPHVVAVDGRSGSGKTTLATALESLVPGSVVVHVDDIAWYEPMFDWHDLLVAGVLAPAALGGAVSFRPPAWVDRGREGAVVVPAGCPAIWVEGVGASRRELREHVDFKLWVQSDYDVSRRRGVARDIQLGRTEQEAEDFWDRWAAQEDTFLATDRPWERADLVVLGSSPATPPPDTVLVSAASR